MSQDLVVFAKNNAELMESQDALVSWMQGKLAESRSAYEEIERNIEIAINNGWLTDGWNKQELTARKKVQYYEKLVAAAAAGYVIVPDFPIDVFAIRTKRNYPVKMYQKTTWSQWDSNDRTQHSEALQIGEGDYVDSVPQQLETRKKDADGKFVSLETWAAEFNGVDFPVKAVKPVILEETSKALALKIFDEIGCNPGRPGWSAGRGTNRGADPMVIGRIMFRQGQKVKQVSFLIAWWLRASDLTV